MATLKDLLVAGPARVVGKIESEGFVITEGTSSQFLKADGSVDENPYITSVTNVTPTLSAEMIDGNKLKFKKIGQDESAQMYIEDSDSDCVLYFNQTIGENNKIATMYDVNNTDSMVFKGTIGSLASGATILELPAIHSVGDTYKVVTQGTYAGVSCNIGDTIICQTSGTTTNNSDWVVVPINLDGVVTYFDTNTTPVANKIAIFEGGGYSIKQSSYTIGANVPSGAKFTDTDFVLISKTEGNAQMKTFTATSKFPILEKRHYLVYIEFQNTYQGLIQFRIDDNTLSPISGKIYINNTVSGANNYNIPVGFYIVYLVDSEREGYKMYLNTKGKITSGGYATLDNSSDKFLTSDGNSLPLAEVARSGDYDDLENTPELGTAASYNVPNSGDDAGNSEVVLGNDSRLIDSRTPTSHPHGDISNEGTITTAGVSVGSDDTLLIADSSNSNKVKKSNIVFDGSTTNKYLSQKGTWEDGTTFSGIAYSDNFNAGTKILSATLPGFELVNKQTILLKSNHDFSADPSFKLVVNGCEGVFVYKNETNPTFLTSVKEGYYICKYTEQENVFKWFFEKVEFTDTNTTLSGIGYCSTGGDTPNKIVTLPGFKFSDGQRILVYFSNDNTYTAFNLIKIRAGGQNFNVKINGVDINANNNLTKGWWVCRFYSSNNTNYCDCTKFKISEDNLDIDNLVTEICITSDSDGGLDITVDGESDNTIDGSGTFIINHKNKVVNTPNNNQAFYPITIDVNGHISSYGTSKKVEDYVIYCDTLASGQGNDIKIGKSVSDIYIVKNRHYLVYMENTNTFNGVIYFQYKDSETTKGKIYIDDKPSSTTNHTLYKGLYVVYYDGNWYFNTDGSITANAYYGKKGGSTGFLKSDGTIDTNTYTTNTGTVTSVALESLDEDNGCGLYVDSDTVTGSGTLSIGHVDYNLGLEAEDATFYKIKIDTYGHIVEADSSEQPVTNIEFNNSGTSIIKTGNTVKLPPYPDFGMYQTHDYFGTVYCDTPGDSPTKKARTFDSEFFDYGVRRGEVFLLYLSRNDSSTGELKLQINENEPKTFNVIGNQSNTRDIDIIRPEQRVQPTKGMYLVYFNGESYITYNDRNPFQDTDNDTIFELSDAVLRCELTEDTNNVFSIIHSGTSTPVTFTEISTAKYTDGKMIICYYNNKIYYCTFVDNNSNSTGKKVIFQSVNNTLNTLDFIYLNRAGGNDIWVVESRPMVPSYSYSDVGKVLGVTGDASSQTLSWVVGGSSETELPSYGSGDVGKVLGVSEDNNSQTLSWVNQSSGLPSGGSNGSNILMKINNSTTWKSLNIVGTPECEHIGYEVGSIGIGDNTSGFTIQAARASIGDKNANGVVRPYSDIDFRCSDDPGGGDSNGAGDIYVVSSGVNEGTNMDDYLDTFHQSMNVNDFGGENFSEDLHVYNNLIVDKSESNNIPLSFIPITFLHHYNTTTGKYESIPYLILPRIESFEEALGMVYGRVDFSYSPKQ